MSLSIVGNDGNFSIYCSCLYITEILLGCVPAYIPVHISLSAIDYFPRLFIFLSDSERYLGSPHLKCVSSCFSRFFMFIFPRWHKIKYPRLIHSIIPPARNDSVTGNGRVYAVPQQVFRFNIF